MCIKGIRNILKYIFYLASYVLIIASLVADNKKTFLYYGKILSFFGIMKLSSAQLFLSRAIIADPPRMFLGTLLKGKSRASSNPEPHLPKPACNWEKKRYPPSFFHPRLNVAYPITITVHRQKLPKKLKIKTN